MSATRLSCSRAAHRSYPNAPQNEFVRPGYELGFEEGGKYYIHNHLRFNILVRATTHISY